MRGCRSPPLSPLSGVLHRLVVPRHPPTAHSVLPGLRVPRPQRSRAACSVPIDRGRSAPWYSILNDLIV